VDKPACETCPYWLVSDRDDNQGTCSRYPPTVPSDVSCQYDPLSMLWPLTYHDTSCGEHPDFPAWIEEQRAARKATDENGQGADST